jgi:dCTP deaminase
MLVSAPPEDFPGLLADFQIEARTKLDEGNPHRLVIEPFFRGDCPDGVISYGLTSYGYDIRLGDKFLLFTDTAAVEVDPKRMNKDRFVFTEGVDSVLIPPNSFVLAESMERVEIPEDCLAIVLGKSTYARCGINLNMTPLEPGWKGIVTIEIANMTRLPARVYAREGIGQVIFLAGAAKCRKHYGLKKGAKYQNQTGLTMPRVTAPERRHDG